MSPVTALVPTFRPFRPDSCSDPPRAIPPFRRYVALDLDADAVPVINYKKLKKDSDSRGGGAGGTSPTRGRNNDDPFPANPPGWDSTSINIDPVRFGHHRGIAPYDDVAHEAVGVGG